MEGFTKSQIEREQEPSKGSSNDQKTKEVEDRSKKMAATVGDIITSHLRYAQRFSEDPDDVGSKIGNTTAPLFTNQLYNPEDTLDKFWGNVKIELMSKINQYMRLEPTGGVIEDLMPELRGKLDKELTEIGDSLSHAHFDDSPTTPETKRASSHSPR